MISQEGFFMGLGDWRKSIKRRFSEFLEIPGDVLLDLPNIVLIGNVQVHFDNHRGIIEYSNNTIRVAVGEGEVVIAGEGLILRNLLPEELHVEGKIHSLNFN
jgi:sporulation protein YqfC